MAKPIGLVLAGGLGRRMGRTKGDLVVGGSTLAPRAARTLAPLCRGVLISVGPGAGNPAPSYPAVEDAPPAGQGPLVGIRAGFVATGGADLLVLACDYPRVDSDLLRRLVEASAEVDDLVFPTDAQGRDHPLVGLWRRRVAGEVERALQSGRRRVGGLVDRCRAKRLGPTELPEIDLDRVLLNLNEPDDLER